MFNIYFILVTKWKIEERRRHFSKQTARIIFYKSVRLYFFSWQRCKHANIVHGAPIHLILKWEKFKLSAPGFTAVSCCATDGSIGSRRRCRGSVTRPTANNSSHLESFFPFFPQRCQNMQTHAGLRFNKSTAASQAGGWKRLQKPSAHQPRPTPAYSPPTTWESLLRAASCRCQVVALCKYTVYCLLLVWQYPGMKAGGDQGGPRRVTRREAEEETLRRGRQESESLCAKIKAHHRETEIFFFFSRLLIPHLHIFDGTTTKEKCEADGV